jgi:uncharacterized protein
MISLDGEQQHHDQTRKLISGRGTFERVYRNLLALKATPSRFSIVLRLHLHQDNVDSQFALVDRLRDDFAADNRFTLHPIALGDFGGESVKTLNHIFIRPNGQLAKCTSALDRDDNNVGRLTSEGLLELDDSKALEWSFGFRTGEGADLSCPFFTKPQEHVIKLVRRAPAAISTTP